jgi:hypothetical protein
MILFGSAAIGGWEESVSDVDLSLVLPDGATTDDRNRLCREVERIELLHGLRHDRPDRPRLLQRLVDKLTANVRSFFICTRSDLLSGDIGRILGVHPSQGRFIDRIVLANIAGSGITAWGEELLPLIPVAPIRRFDVLKSFFGLFCQAMLYLEVFSLLPGATKYSMGTLKRSVHSCFFCYQLRRAPLEEEVRFLQRRLRPSRALTELLALRRDYRSSFAFVLRCLPALIRLHLRTAIDNRFPRSTRGVDAPQSDMM